MHDERNQKIILAPLNTVVHHSNNERREKTKLRHRNEDRWNSSNNWAHDRNEFCKECQHRERECIGHLQNRECNKDKKPNREREDNLSAYPQSQFCVNCFRFGIGIPAETVWEKNPCPSQNPLLLNLEEEAENEDEDELYDKLHHGSRNIHDEENRAFCRIRKLLSKLLHTLEDSTGVEISEELPEHSIE